MGSGLGRVTKHPIYYLNDGSISFLTDNTLFRVHKSFFDRESVIFRDLFASSVEVDPQAGTDESPFTLDVTADDFALLLWVWYDTEYSHHQQTKQNWITILGLASRWEFHKIRELAIYHLDGQNLSPAERISIYTDHGIDDDRLLDSYVELCKSPVVPTEADGRLLQMETLINILQAREDAQRQAAELGHESPTSASLGDESLRETVMRFFKKSLGSRSDGRSTGSGAQASRLGGERHQRAGVDSTIKVRDPQVPDRKAQPATDPSSHTNNSPQAGKESQEEKQESQANGNDSCKKTEKPRAGEEEGREKSATASQDSVAEEKEKEKARTTKERQEREEKVRKDKERENEKQEKAKVNEKEEGGRTEKEARQAEQQKTKQTPPRSAWGK